MFAKIDFDKLQAKLSDNNQFSVEIYASRNVFNCFIREAVLDEDGMLTNEERVKPRQMSSGELAEWIDQ